VFAVGTMSAYATGTGSANGNTAQIAAQAVTPASLIATGSIQYVETAAIPTGTYEVYVKLNGGTFAQSAGGSIPAATLVAQVAGAAVGGFTVSAGTISADQTFAVYSVAVPAAGVPANTTTFTFKPTGITKSKGAVTGVVASAGVSLSATMSIGSSASLSTTTPQADEGTASSAPIVTFVNGITDGALSSGLFTGASLPLPYVSAVNPETAVIDVVNAAGLGLINAIGGAAGTINAGASSELIDLGGFYFADVNSTHTASPGTAPFGPDAVTGFNIDTDYVGATSTASVTAPAGFFNPASAKGAITTGSVYLSSNANCAIGNKIAATASISADGSTVSFSAIPVTAAAAGAGVFSAQATGSAVAFVCMEAAVPNAIIWTPGQTYVTATLNPPAASTVQSVTLAKSPLYNLQTNGGSAYVRSYIPAAAGGGYQSFIRVINTGAVTANVSAAIVSQAGVTGTAGVFIKALPAGGSITVPSSTVEAAIVTAGGTAPAATDRPRLFVSAPTTIAVQSFFLSPNGDFNEVSSGAGL